MSAPRHSHRAHPEAASEPVSRQPHRTPVVIMVAVLLAAGAVIGGVAARRGPQARLEPAGVVAEVAPAGSQSSSWYCTGGTGPSNPVGQAALLVVNTGRRQVRASVRVVDDSGKSAVAPLSVPAGGEVSVTPGKIVAGEWLSSQVDVGGGGVTVSELVSGGSGWAVTPCASEASATWYFATGSTALGNAMYVSLYNPTATLAVADIAFVTSHGLEQPQAYQGIVLPPGATATETVGSFVQDQPSVATEVSARSGEVVASQLEVDGAGGVSGMSLRLGAPEVARTWDVPRADDPQGGTAQLVVLNPTTVSERVRVSVQLPSGAVAPFVQQVAPGAAWSLATSQQLRVPAATLYAVRVSATGGPGVVVGRTEAGPSTGPAPQWGSAEALPGPATSTSRRWVLPSVAPSGVAGAQGPASLALENPGPRPVSVTVSTLTPSGQRRLVGPLRLAGRSFAAVPVGKAAVMVAANGPVAATGNESPATATGVISFPAVPLG